MSNSANEQQQPTSEQQPISEEIANRIIAKIVEKTGSPDVSICPICRRNSWAIGAYVQLPITADPRQAPFGGSTFPTVAVFCNTCGNTQLINLLVLGFTAEDFPSLARTDPNG
jgi:hypothetical protein